VAILKESIRRQFVDAVGAKLEPGEQVIATAPTASRSI
jgi:hypothetical protein